MNIVILDANTLTLDNDIDFSVFNQYGDVTIYQSSTDEEGNAVVNGVRKQNLRQPKCESLAKID